jgi:hypothetical protein
MTAVAECQSWKVGFSLTGFFGDSQLVISPFYKKGCQEKQFRGDWRASGHPARRCNEAL